MTPHSSSTQAYTDEQYRYALQIAGFTDITFYPSLIGAPGRTAAGSLSPLWRASDAHDDKPQQLLQRLDDIGASSASTNKALALIGLGSVGVELDRLDDYSDLDFFVVVKDGHKAEFIANLDWLSRARPIDLHFQEHAGWLQGLV